MLSYTIGTIVKTAANLYVFLIFVYVLMSWFPHNRGFVASLYEALRAICEPYLSIFRRILPSMGGIDFSPIIAIFVLQLLVRLVFSYF